MDDGRSPDHQAFAELRTLRVTTERLPDGRALRTYDWPAPPAPPGPPGPPGQPAPAEPPHDV